MKYPFSMKNNSNNNSSPNELSGVKRLNKLPLYVVGILVLIFVIFVAIAASGRVENNRNKKENFTNLDSSVHADQILKKIPERGMYEAMDEPQVTEEYELEHNYNTGMDKEESNSLDVFDATVKQERFEIFKNALRSPSTINNNTNIAPINNSSNEPPRPPTDEQQLQIQQRIERAKKKADDLSEAYDVYEQILKKLE